MNIFKKIMSICVCIIFSTSLDAMLVTSLAYRRSSTVAHRRSWFGGAEDPRWQEQQRIRRRNQDRQAYNNTLDLYRKCLKKAKTNEEKERLQKKIDEVYCAIDFMDRWNGKE